MYQTNRTFTNVETAEVFYLWITEADKFLLQSANGTDSEPYHATAIDQIIKLNTGKVVKLKAGQFYALQSGEVVTHKKFEETARFQKV